MERSGTGMRLLNFENSKFYFNVEGTPPNLENQLRKRGFVKNVATLRWETRSFYKAKPFRRYANQDAELQFKKFFITENVPPESIIYPDDLAPRTWQIASAKWALSRTPAYIADEAGLGKTISAILAINSDPGPALIVCPPYLKYNWEDEINKWKRGSWVSRICPDSILHQVESRHGLKWFIVDEYQRFKNEDARRTLALQRLANPAERIVFLSGTPLPNGQPLEVYNSLKDLAPETFDHMELHEFGKKFCAGRLVTRYEGKRTVTNWDFKGASNLKELGQLMRRKLMIRHLKKDHLKELGPKTRQFIFLDTPDEILKLEKEKFKNISLEDLIKENFNAGDIATYRKQVGLAKVKSAIEYIRDHLESSNEKLVVSAHHIEVVEALCTALKKYKPLKIRGGMSAKAKHEAVKTFQTDKKRRLTVGNALSMGLGNTMTKSPYLFSVEPDWSPGVNEQMEDRIYRMGQEQNVYCRYLVLRNSLDERMLRRVLDKENNIQKTLNER